MIRTIFHWIAPLYVIVIFLFLFVPQAIRSEEYDLSLRYASLEKYKVTSRSDLRTYINRKFSGLSYRERRGQYEIDMGSAADGKYRVSGNLYIFEETKRNKRNVAKKIDKTVPVSFTIDETGRRPDVEAWLNADSEESTGGKSPGGGKASRDGSSVPAPDPGYPAGLNFPVWPAEPVEIGEEWESYGVRLVDPLREGVYTRLRFYCRYRLEDVVEKEGRSYATISAQYAIRYRQGEDPAGDPGLLAANGMRMAQISFDLGAGRLVFINERVDESFRYEDGEEIAFKGFVLTWFSDVISLEKERIAERIEDDLKESELEDVEVQETDEGVRLRVNKIRFVADKALVLPEERPRLVKLAAALKKIEDANFKVVGHTADVGSEESQFTLSEERAKTIVDYLIESGINADRLIYEGRGGREPIAPNDSEENRAKNRRVEIVILED